MRFLALVVVLIGGVAKASDDMAPIMVQNAQIAASIGTAKTGAGYFTMMNHGAADDRLLAVEADFPRVEIHDIVASEGDMSVMKMERQDDGVVLSAGAKVTFAPGGLHVMFMGLTAPFSIGDSIEAVLVFATAGEVPVVFDVVDRSEIGGGMAHDHGSD